MKHTKRIFAMVLAVIMVMSLATTVFAEETTYTLTLNKALEGHTYTAYQIFAGDLSNEGVLSNIVWGSGVNTNAEGFNLGNAADKAATLEDAEDAEAFAAAVAPYLATEAGSATVTEGATSCTITGLKAGYYLIQTTDTPDKDGVKTYYVMKVVADTEANIKADAPEVEKKIVDGESRVDSTEANIGDTVTFVLTATMPTNLQGYETYKVVFHDTLSAGLDFTEGSVKVTVAGKDKTTAFDVAEENGTLTISCNDVLALEATTSTKIVVTYDAVLDSDAVIGTDGNLNEVYLEYSNDPNWNGEGDEPTGDTPEDEVKVYTWEIPVFKYTGTDTALPGAGFTLYTDAECTTAVTVTKDASVTDKNVYKVDPASKDAEIITDDTGKFEIEGLKQGTYYLKETTTPAGYNSLPGAVTVVIGENGALTQGSVATDEVAIQNNAGTTLPETGGMGTTLFYTFGSVMVLAAVVLLVTKKRMAA